MKRPLLSLIAAFAVVAGAGPAQAASETLHFSFKGQFAEAFFSSTDPSGCVATLVFVNAADGRVKTMPSGPEVQSEASMFVSRIDQCTGTQLIEAEGFAELTPEEFQADRLHAATLGTTIELFDFLSATSFPVEVNIAWTGTGASVTERNHSHFSAPGFKVNARFSGTVREATATGPVTDGTTNFTPEPAVSAHLSSVKLGEVEITHE